jgi:hypothetical protein
MESRATPIPTTIRVAQHRERRRAGLRQFQFFGDEVEVVERLIEAECLAPGDGDDEKAICAVSSLDSSSSEYCVTQASPGSGTPTALR